MNDCGLHADDLGYLIKQISDKMRANADAVFRKHGLCAGMRRQCDAERN